MRNALTDPPGLWLSITFQGPDCVSSPEVNRDPEPGGGGPRQTTGPAASCDEPGSVVTELHVQISLCHMLQRGLEQIPSPC